MEVIAKARNIRISPRKIRLVIDLVRGMDAGDALAQLAFFRKAAAKPVSKLIRSAMANAEHNFKLDAGTLYVKKIFADAGPVLHRWRARAFGRAAPIRKRGAHITVVLEERPSAGTSKAAAPKGAAAGLVRKAAAKMKTAASSGKAVPPAKGRASRAKKQ